MLMISLPRSCVRVWAAFNRPRCCATSWFMPSRPTLSVVEVFTVPECSLEMAASHKLCTGFLKLTAGHVGAIGCLR